jgi:CheY-like chemotaxis protein
MDGFEVARRLSAVHDAPAPRIFAITGHSGDDYRSRSLAAGCEQHLVKPVDSEKLLRLLESR